MQVSTKSPPEDGIGGTDDEVWQNLVQAATAEQLAQSWLVVLCTLLPKTRGGLLLLEDGEHSYAPVALWPADTDLRYLAPTAEAALNQRKGVIQREVGQEPRFGYPLLSEGHLYGAVVVELAQARDGVLTQAMRVTHWGVGWLVDLFNRQKVQQWQAKLTHSSFLLDLVLAELGDNDYQQSSLAVVNKLATQFECHQVQLGIEKGQSIKVIAVSHSAWFDDKSQWITLAAKAMNEAFDQRMPILWPEDVDGALQITDAHRHYAQETGSNAIYSLPLEAGIDLIGVVMLERNRPFTDNERDILETLALALAPVLALKKQHQESLLAHAERVGRRAMLKVTDASHPGLKLLGILLAAFLLLTSLISTNFRVSAPSVVEGAVLRAMVAPFEGFIREAPVRAGDVVHAGQLLVKLEDKDLQLEKIRWQSELDVALRKEREAMAKSDRVNLRQAAAQADQARAQLNLTLERLNRLAITAPFTGVIVKGDLSQKLGSPVQQGDVQFELAPLDAWRVILKVDERDIAHIADQQTGELVLTSLPNKVWPFHVEKVTPVALAEDGRNYFRVEAKLSEDATVLRPNMEGVGKIDTGEQPLLWIWTHRLLDWLRLTLWEWLP
jgi:multidrug resistance efflux pump